MKVSGFTIARNAIRLGYPIEQSIRSLLPLVDELVVAVGDSDDGTSELVSGIGDPKIKAFPTTWDMTKRAGGVVLAEQTNLALARCTGDWAVYLQTDELLHEDEIDLIRGRLQRHLHSPVEGLSFSYLHFYGSYGTVQDNWCRWYWREVRAVKTGIGVVSIGDAAGFKIDIGGRRRRLIRADSGARVYHYGWSRPPAVMSEKRQHIQGFYQGEGHVAGAPAEPMETENPYHHLGHLRRFNASHPALMAGLVAAQGWKFEPHIDAQAPQWLRYLRLLYQCPRDSARVAVSRMLLAWNSYIPAPKLR
ncbi:MAG: glycosyltransferase family 2 protein [Candidatus Dormibacteraceae bacterium]